MSLGTIWYGAYTSDIRKSLSSKRGPVAQLGARFHGMEEVVGSIPTRSTIFQLLADTRPFNLVSLGVTTQQALRFSWKRSSRSPTRSAIFSTTCRYPVFEFGVIWLQNAVTASVVWKKSSGALRVRSTGPLSFETMPVRSYSVLSRQGSNSRLSTASRSASILCSETSRRHESRSKHGREVN
jgi:hypothetical protein